MPALGPIHGYACGGSWGASGGQRGSGFTIPEERLGHCGSGQPNVHSDAMVSRVPPTYRETCRRRVLRRPPGSAAAWCRRRTCWAVASRSRSRCCGSDGRGGRQSPKSRVQTAAAGAGSGGAGRGSYGTDDGTHSRAVGRKSSWAEGACRKLGAASLFQQRSSEPRGARRSAARAPCGDGRMP